MTESSTYRAPEGLKEFLEGLSPIGQRLREEAARRIDTKERPPGTLYHYTNPAGLKGIIESQNLWATNVQYLNDAKELTYSHELIKSALEHHLEISETEDERDLIGRMISTSDFRDMLHIYSISFSEDDDSLSQWRGYAGSTGGYAIGFDLRFIPEHLTMVKIEYDHEKQKDICKSIVSDTLNSFRAQLDNCSGELRTFLKAEYCRFLRNSLFPFTLSFKSKHWHSEKEWRIITGHAKWEDGDNIKFRAGSIGLTPYMEVPLYPRWGVYTGRLPITEIVQGPAIHRELATESLRMLLRSSKYSMTSIRQSDVPLRF